MSFRHRSRRPWDVVLDRIAIVTEGAGDSIARGRDRFHEAADTLFYRLAHRRTLAIAFLLVVAGIVVALLRVTVWAGGTQSSQPAPVLRSPASVPLQAPIPAPSIAIDQ